MKGNGKSGRDKKSLSRVPSLVDGLYQAGTSGRLLLRTVRDKVCPCTSPRLLSMFPRRKPEKYFE